MSSYGSEFIAGRISVEEVIALRGALQALGVPVKSPTKWYGDNLGMLQSSIIIEATLKKRHVNIAHEQVAANVLTPIKVPTGSLHLSRCPQETMGQTLPLRLWKEVHWNTSTGSYLPGPSIWSIRSTYVG